MTAQPLFFDAFAIHAKSVGERFEQRRARFLRQLKFRCAIGLVLLASFPWWYTLLVRWDAGGGSLVWLLIHTLAGLIIVTGIIAFAMMPLFRYRHYRADIITGLVQQDISLKGEIFSQLFRYFGDFMMHGDRALALKSFRDAPDMPEFDRYVSEDYIRGTTQGISVEITEITLLAQRDGGEAPLFGGMMIVLDINNSDLVLHGKFSGKTVIIADRPRASDYVATKYEGYRKVAMPDSSFEQHFEAFATDAEEAGRLLTTDLLRNLLRLSETVSNAKEQSRAIDDRVAYAISGMATRGSEILTLAAKRLLQWFRTGSFRTRATRPEMQRIDGAIPPDVQGLNSSVHCAFYEDKVLITIPYQHNLFEPDSIFSPPLHAEDIRLSYDLMAAVAGIIRAVLGALPKSAF